jgi:hypothetical protein
MTIFQLDSDMYSYIKSLHEEPQLPFLNYFANDENDCAAWGTPASDSR